MSKNHLPFLLTLALCAPLPSALAADTAADPAAAAEHYWPQWRGPLATGVAPHAAPPLSWSETKNVRWKVAIPGSGHASPIVWGDRVFVLTAVLTDRPAPGHDPEDDSDEESSDRGRRGIQPTNYVRFEVHALDRATGKTVWSRLAREAVPAEGTHPHATWASASAVTDGERIYASFGSQGLYAYDWEGGLVWQKDLGDMRTRNGFGEGASPALWGDALIVNWDHEGDSFLVVLDKRDGSERWRVERDEVTTWSTPVVVEVDGKAQVVVSATERVRGYDLATGEVLWQTGGMTVNVVPSPVAAAGMVYVTSGFRGAALKAVRLAAARGELGEDAIAWTYDRDTPYVPSPLLAGGALYFVKENSGIFTSLDAATGEVRYGPVRLPGIDSVYASLVGAAGRVYVAGRDGTVLVLGAGDELEVLAENVLDDGFDASPAIAGDEIFLRGREHLYAIAAEDPPAASE